MMLEPIEQRIDQRLVVEQLIPPGIVTIRSYYCSHLPIALIHQAKESVDLFGLQIQVAQFVNQ